MNKYEKEHVIKLYITCIWKIKMSNNKVNNNWGFRVNETNLRTNSHV